MVCFYDFLDRKLFGRLISSLFAIPLAMIFVTPSFLAPLMFLGSRIEIKGLYLGGGFRGEWEKCIAPTCFF